MTTAKDLDYNGYTSVLVSYPNGEQALWVRDDYLAGISDTPGTYSLCDVVERYDLAADTDLAGAVDEWKRETEWNDGEGLHA